VKCCVIVSEYETVDKDRKEVIPNGQALGHHTVASGSMLRILLCAIAP
jgi:hypothetical protein